MMEGCDLCCGHKCVASHFVSVASAHTEKLGFFLAI